MNQLAVMIFSVLFGYVMGSIAAALGADGRVTAAVVVIASGAATGWAMRRSLA